MADDLWKGIPRAAAPPRIQTPAPPPVVLPAEGQLYDEHYFGAVLASTVLENKWIPWNHRERQKDGRGLTDKQVFFLVTPHREAFYGGAAGGGKSDALLMAALQYVDVPGYAAVIFRRTYKDLSRPGALLDRAYAWLSNTSARWRQEDKSWTFPNPAGAPAKLVFAHMEHENDKYEHQSAEYQFIGWDELTQFPETQYVYLHSRLRRLAGFQVPLRVRAASNPGGIGHVWVKHRFVKGPDGKEVIHPSRVFVPASLYDNPNLDIEEYLESLGEMDPITKRRLLEGDWDVVEGGKFNREWFEIVSALPAELLQFRYWDLAGTTPQEGTDPDYTAGVKLGKTRSGVFYVSDVRHIRGSPHTVEKLVKQTAMLDGPEVEVFIEQEPGQSGKAQIDHYRRNVIPGFRFRGDKATGNKELRINILSGQAQAENVKLLAGRWNGAYLDEAEGYQGTYRSGHDDQLDATAGGMQQLNLRVFGKRVAMIPPPDTTEGFQNRAFSERIQKRLAEVGKSINRGGMRQTVRRGTMNW